MLRFTICLNSWLFWDVPYDQLGKLKKVAQGDRDRKVGLRKEWKMSFLQLLSFVTLLSRHLSLMLIKGMKWCTESTLG